MVYLIIVQGITASLQVHALSIADNSGSECRLASERVQSLEIRLANVPGSWAGGIYYRERLLARFHVGASNGYGSNWWTIPAKQESGGQLGGEAIRFSGPTPTRSAEAKISADKYLFLGLGRVLHYGASSIPGLELRYTPEGRSIIQAGEGFWMIGKDCIDRFVF